MTLADRPAATRAPSATACEQPLPPPGSTDNRPSTNGQVYLWLILASLVLSAASLSFASTASYDPWAWILWGREIAHGSLSLTFGPSWKPLPVIFTTIFAALGGSLAPNLWILVARAGAFLAVLMAFKVAAQVAWWARFPRESPRWALARAGALAPALLAGVAAAGSLAFAGGFASDSAMGYSEGIAIAFTLIAIERAVDGHHRQAFTLGVVIAWERPESWLAWGPYGLWLMWRDPGARLLVASLALATLAVWFVPQKLGGGSLTSSVSRAQQIDPGSPTIAAFPFGAELAHRALPSIILRSLLVGCAGICAGLWPVLTRRITFRHWLTSDQHRPGRWICGLAGAGLGWWILIALETQDGFSGNERYIQIGSALIDVAAGATLGWAAYAFARWISDRDATSRRYALASKHSVGLSALAVATVFAFAPGGWIGNDVTSLSGLRNVLHYQARLRRDLGTVIARAGGFAAINRCGEAMTENYQVPMVAWYLHLRIDQIDATPQVNAAGQALVAAGRWPAVILQTAPVEYQPLGPLDATIAGWQSQGARYSVTRQFTFTLYQDCRAGS